MLSIKETIMQRDGISSEDADALIAECRDVVEEAAEMNDLEMAEEAIMDYFGLEPDYLMELLPV